MKKHLTKDDSHTNLTINIYKTNEHHWTIHGEIHPTKPTTLLEITINHDQNIPTYNLNLQNLPQLKDKNNFKTNREEKHCLYCGKEDSGLLYIPETDTHHFHPDCHTKFTNTLQEFLNNNSTLLTKLEI